MKRISILCSALLLPACSGQGGGNAAADSPGRPDQWVQTVTVQPDTKVEYVGKTSPVLSSTTVQEVADIRKVAIGDTVNGVRVGAIKCTFFAHDAGSGSEQFMWRGRWGCMAGRNQAEIDNAVREDGTKAFDYIHLAPITI
ncbi:conserved exported hypothetical protein [Sphingomonas aurantiaca]|jgi:hypothetical protein|uniref:Lipoprotein n=1 Tax=Sphingomonas aurantiaca TaxID=185949 RepID=A0A5E8AJQ0_9SPHN|nr:conserved exported hypothetical protein [Sphingomonas aurantiaca]